ncbi:MAG: T9SS type A sorting domain-containing protein, partial [Dysgonamonadaceae bacterium]|nr:T9SS type A sorting domain-containing protein [Dysgonamonadaceae bacterium]
QTGIQEVASTPIRIANSGQGLVTITGLQGKETISLIDINGRILRKTTAHGATATIDVNTLSGGVYIVAVQNGKRLTVLKFIR